MKALVLHWLAGTDVSIAEFERLLETEYAAEEETVYGEFDAELNFHPLTDEQMIHQSLEALEEYRRTGKGITHAHVQEWVNNLGTDYELSCPQ